MFSAVKLVCIMKTISKTETFTVFKHCSHKLKFCEPNIQLKANITVYYT